MVVGEFSLEADLLVIGGGPGGYHAAFRAAENGIKTALVEMMPSLGGICLHHGCIPSKTYLSMVETIHTAELSKAMGIEFGKPKLNVDAIRGWKDEVIRKLAGGLDTMVKKHKIERLFGRVKFEDAKHVTIEDSDVARIKFRRAIIATGSRPIELRGIQIESPRVLNSRTALQVEDIPKTLLVIGGGYIGLELGQVYAGFGSQVTVVEMTSCLLPGADSDLVRPLKKRLDTQFAQICLNTKVVGMKEVKGGIVVAFEGKNPPKSKKFDKVLVAVGRFPNSGELALEKAGIESDEKGFIKVDDRFKTTSARIYAIGDVIGNPMLAHKAAHEGMVVADNLADKDERFEPRSIPAVVFTDPEIAWAGYTEAEAKAEKLDIIVKKMPWSASGRAVALGRTDGVTKLIFEKPSQRLIGVGLTGLHVGEMIAEGVHAMEMGAVAYDLQKTIHPHPTLSETIGEVATFAAV
ncbi:MAG: dihydrolipoyl dehydrogenase [Planctomycetes bacterium]|nr:dihydrolipoyl dehydrogenase [Planctomycetota bacterium]